MQPISPWKAGKLKLSDVFSLEHKKLIIGKIHVLDMTFEGFAHFYGCS